MKLLTPGTMVYLPPRYASEGEVVAQVGDEVTVRAGLLKRRKIFDRYEVKTNSELLEQYHARQESEERAEEAHRHEAAAQSVGSLAGTLGVARQSARMSENDGRRQAIQHLCDVVESLLGKIEHLEQAVGAHEKTLAEQERELEQLRKWAQGERRL